jgi:hypothetical protein
MLKIDDETKKTGYYKSVLKETLLETAQTLLISIGAGKDACSTREI